MIRRNSARSMHGSKPIDAWAAAFARCVDSGRPRIFRRGATAALSRILRRAGACRRGARSHSVRRARSFSCSTSRPTSSIWKVVLWLEGFSQSLPAAPSFSSATIATFSISAAEFILHLERGTLTLYSGNYETFVATREARAGGSTRQPQKKTGKRARKAHAGLSWTASATNKPRARPGAEPPQDDRRGLKPIEDAARRADCPDPHS